MIFLFWKRSIGKYSLFIKKRGIQKFLNDVKEKKIDKIFTIQ